MLEKLFPKIEAPDGAKSLTKQGAIGILLFAGMNIAGLLFVVFANKSPVDLNAVDAQGVQEHVLGIAILLPVLFFFAFRVYTGKGWLVAGLTFVWFVAEISLKVVGGSTNVGWMIFYFFVAVAMLNGIRGCWWLRKNGEAGESSNTSHDTRPGGAA